MSTGQELTLDALLRLVSQYFPHGLGIDDPGYDSSEEAHRLARRLEEARQDMRPWEGFIQRLREEFPDCLLWDKTLLWHDPCYNVQVSLPGVTIGGGRYDTVACLLSLLAPVYVLYASHLEEKPTGREAWTRYPPLPTEFQSHEARLARLVESSFGFTRLPNEVLFTPVPGFRPRTGHFISEEPQLIDLLFTPQRW